MDRVSWKEKKSNENVLKDIGIKTTLLETIIRRRLGFYGHIRRHETLQKMTMEGMVEGTRGRGRKRTTWTGNITENAEMPINVCAEMAMDREKWRIMTADLFEMALR